MKDDNPLYVSKRSKRGILVFLIISLAIVFAPRVINALSDKEKFEITELEVKEFRENVAAKEYQKQNKKSYKKKSRFKKPKSKFDPNLYTEKDWMILGLSKKQTAVVLKFTDRGIYSNEQLEKIFVIPEELFLLIKDSTYFPTNRHNQQEYKKDDSKKTVVVELNTADQEMLESIPGIGSFYAKNILKYRQQLGGFHKKEQLLEVWKMDVEKYSTIEKYVEIDVTLIKMIELNSITIEELKNHPYIDWSIANSIIKMRNQKGTFKSVQEIKESVLIDKELFEKLKPYLSL